MKKKLLMLSCLLAVSAFAVGCDDEVAHTHSFAKDWTTSETEHWHVASCEHNTEVSDKANHVDADKDGDCDVCAYEIGTKGYVNEAVAKAVAKASTINGAKIVMANDYSSEPDYLTYVVGENAVKLTYSNTAFGDDRTSNTEEYTIVYSAMGEEGSFGIMEFVTGEGDDAVTSYMNRVDAPAGAHKAVALPGSELYMEEDFITTEAVLAKLWEIASANANGACEYAVNGDVYSFNADYMDVDETYYLSVNVEFTLAGDESLASAYVEVVGYHPDDIAENEDENAPAVLNKYALPDFHRYITVEQTVGEKTYTAPAGAKADAHLTTDFAMYTDAELTTEVGTTALNAVAGENFFVYLDGSEITWTNEVVSVVPSDSSAFETAEYMEGHYSTSAENLLCFYATKAGTYTVTVSTELSAEKTFTLNVVLPPVSYFYAYMNEAYVSDDDASLDLYTAMDYVFSGRVNPQYAEQGYTIACSDADALTDNGDGTYTFNATEEGTYTLTYTSVGVGTEGDAVTLVLTLTLTDIPTIDEALANGKIYVDDVDASRRNVKVTVNNTSYESGTLNVAVAVMGYQTTWYDLVYNYTYDATNGLVATLDEDNSNMEIFNTYSEIAVSMNSSMNIVVTCVYPNGYENDYECQELVVPAVTSVLANGAQYSGYDGDIALTVSNTNYDLGTMTVVWNAQEWVDGEGYVSATYTYVFNYTYVSGVFTAEMDTDNSSTTPPQGVDSLNSITVTLTEENAVVVSFDQYGYTNSITMTAV